ncbi:DNA-3-methyladenine glycosylase [Arthrobacter roseus]|uniref:DNA-3-methyladenine glycosylase n=1 Tax=Arthrobacter roseus TaxID=136274 RepID=UPI00196369F6|nr:DNA-3-methyladenine glycosylase [Arthrobacter roseus]MBM7848274.1 DNA-3-methyladenine glycosylase [Arthrobacter roseus]
MTNVEKILAGAGPDVAPMLLGSVLSRTSEGREVSIRITEVEAYFGSRDPGSHAFKGRTTRNAVMFGPAGRLYVYFTYGIHHCTNIVCGPNGTATAVLLRGGEVLTGLETARERRRHPVQERTLARGPANFAQALGLDLSHNGLAVSGPEVVLSLPEVPVPSSSISTGPRVGVNGEGGSTEYPWRFWITGEPTVSAYRAASSRNRSKQ